MDYGGVPHPEWGMTNIDCCGQQWPTDNQNDYNDEKLSIKSCIIAIKMIIYRFRLQ